MFINFTSSVIAQGSPFTRPSSLENPVSINFRRQEFMSRGFRRSHTVCDCFEDDYWKSMISWEIDYD